MCVCVCVCGFFVLMSYKHFLERFIIIIYSLRVFHISVS